MTERPILFSAPMVRAILDGRKTQTRRVAKGLHAADTHPQMTAPGRATFISLDYANPYDGALDVTCPYGRPGDRMYVKESWCRIWDSDEIVYQASTQGTPTLLDADGNIVLRKDGSEASAWRSPRFMPRAASRVILEVVSVRVERLQDISEADAIAEGTPAVGRALPETGNIYTTMFKEIWDSINAKRGHSWNSNPWVWVIEFKRVDHTDSARVQDGGAG